jgi:hypothetical protein
VCTCVHALLHVYVCVHVCMSTWTAGSNYAHTCHLPKHGNFVSSLKDHRKPPSQDSLVGVLLGPSSTVFARLIPNCMPTTHAHNFSPNFLVSLSNTQTYDFCPHASIFAQPALWRGKPNCCNFILSPEAQAALLSEIYSQGTDLRENTLWTVSNKACIVVPVDD